MIPFQTMAYVRVFFNYVVLIAYLLIRFFLVILEPYETVTSLAVFEAAFMNREVHMLQTFIRRQVWYQPWSASASSLVLGLFFFSPFSCYFGTVLWVRPGTSAVMLKIKAMPLAYCCVSGERILMRMWALCQLRKSLSLFFVKLRKVFNIVFSKF